MISKELIVEQLQQYISKQRMAHTFRVETVAMQLATIHRADNNIVKAAALLHDIAKKQTPESMTHMGVSISAKLNNLWVQYPAVWHAFAGPLLIEHIFGLDNQHVNEAIRYHTTGYDQLSTEAKVIYVADFIEPDRRHSCVEIVANFANTDLDKAVAAVTFCSIDKLQKKAVSIHPNTQKCWDAFGSYLNKTDVSILQGRLNEN